MLESEVAETLMSLSAPDERQLDNPLYASELPWQASKKRAFDASGSSSARASASTSGAMASSLPSSSFMPPRGESYGAALSLLQHKIQERPLTSMIPGRRYEHERASDDSSDVDMDSQEESDEYAEKPRWAYRSPFDGLVAAARDQASNQDDNDQYAGNSRPISIPMRGHGNAHGSSGYHHDGRPFSSSAPRFHDSGFSFGKKQKASSLSRVEERGGGGFLERDCSPTGVEDEDVWHDGDYKQRMRLASVCSSEGSEYGGLGRQHLEEFIRMEISAAHEGEQGASPSTTSGKFIGSYSPEARRKRIDRFLEKRKRRVWAKKVDYDVRKNFANSRLRVKGRFVKKEDEELLCQLMSYT